MKKVLFSAAVALGIIGISVSNFGTTNAQVPTSNHSYIVKDTVPSDTTKPKDSTLLKFQFGGFIDRADKAFAILQKLCPFIDICN